MKTVNEKKDFDKEASAWDDDPIRVKLAQDVADAIVAETRPATTMVALDFGCGTGLVTLRLQPQVKEITGVDSSQGMLAVLETKVRRRGLTNVQTRLVDLEQGGRIDGTFDLIVSSMTLHHVPDASALVRRLADHVRSGGSIAIADLDTEDGSFHADTTGVFHYGFERRQLERLFEVAGFSDVRDRTAAMIVRPGGREFSVFLMTGRKA